MTFLTPSTCFANKNTINKDIVNKNSVNRTVFHSAFAGGALAALLLLSGCSNNAQDSASIVSQAQAESTTTTKTSVNATSNADVVTALQNNLSASGIEAKIVSAVPTDMPDMYWVTVEGMPSFFTDKAGKHIIQGQIVQIGGAEPVDISASLIARTAKEKLAAVDKKEMIIYPATGETKGVIYAFTDADCGYCRKLHEEIKQTNDLGIEVRYLAWPRSEQSIPKAEAIWCSADRNKAMDNAKAGTDVTAPSCDNPVREHMALGASLGVQGTPAIFTENGYQIGGYLPPQQIKAAIDSL